MRKRNFRKKVKRQRRIVIITSFILLVTLSAGYAAFNTNITLKARGNIKDVNDVVDGRVPTDSLLFWGEASNKDNSLTTFKNKVNGSDGVLYGFDSSSGFIDDELVFDGTNDFVDLGFSNYDFKNSISYVAYVKIDGFSASDENAIFNNEESSGGALSIMRGIWNVSVFDGSKYVNISGPIPSTDKYYTAIGTFDGNTIKLYLDGKLVATGNSSAISVSKYPMLIGANPSNTYFSSKTVSEMSKMSLKEAMLYDRALSESEVVSITDGFNKKYKNQG